MTAADASGREVLLLLGSGASPTALSVSRLTESLLSDNTSEGDYDHAAVRALLKRLRRDIAKWKKKKLENVSYEEIGAVCSSLDKEFGTGRNAANAPYWTKLAKDLGLSIGRSSRTSGGDSLAGLFLRAVEWMKCRVARELSNCAPSTGSSSIQAFLDFVSSRATTWSIATLNHDCWIENAISSLNEEFSDGFSLSGAMCEFHPSRLRSRRDRLLLKLHGSTDWRWHLDRQNYVKTASGTDDIEVFRAYHVPELLIGTFNKLEDYSYAIYPYLFAALDRLLAHASVIVTSGYGFGDAGVNGRLFSELRYRSDLRMLVIHPAPRNLLMAAPDHAQHELRRHTCSGQIAFCRCRFDEAVLNPHREKLGRFISK